jgi:hypothetical protein
LILLRQHAPINGVKVFAFVFYTHKRLDRFDTWTHRVDHYFSNTVATLLPQFAKGIIMVAQASSIS